MRIAQYRTMTGSGQVYAKRCNLLGFLLGMDGINDTRFALHHGTGSGDEKCVPSATYDAAALGINGAEKPYLVYCPSGLYFNAEAGANFECIVYFETF